MRRERALAVILAMAACVGLGGCLHINNPLHNPFSHKSTSKYAGHGERINVLPTDTLSVSDTLRGQDFFLPDPQPTTDWPLPGGAPTQSVERPNAGAGFTVAWRRKFGRASNNDYHVTAPPVAANGRVYVMDGEAEVSAYEIDSGREVWRRNLAERSRRQREAFGGGLAYADGRLFVTSGYRFVSALDAGTGKLIWRTQTDAPVHAAPTVADGRVYAESTDDDLLTFDAATGAPGWSHQGLQETARILSAVSHSGLFAAVDLRTGAERWTLPITSVTTPWPAGDVVYVSDTEGRVLCISRDTGQIYWINDLNLHKLQKQRADWSGPMLTGPYLVLVSSKGDAVALNPKTGAVERRLRIGSDSLMTPIAVGPDLYVATQAAELIAIR